MDKTTSINKNTYYMLPTWFVHSCMTISRAKSGKYLLTNKDNSNKNYVVLKLYGIVLKVPFRALFDTNNKIKPIVSLSFSSAIECPSDSRGLCQLTNSCLSCYAKNGQKRASATHTNKGYQCINSFMNSQLVMACLNKLYNDLELLSHFSGFINHNYKIVRFNLKGDFKNSKDLFILSYLVNRAFMTTFYGYSARDDLLDTNNGYDNYLRAKNCFLNGSNKQYSNRFKVTYDLKEWFNSPNKCLGGCIGCHNCFKLRNATINCLLHNKNSDIILNTLKNRIFLKKLLRCLGVNITNKDLKAKSGLLESLNHWFKCNMPYPIEFDSFLDFYYYVNDNYLIMDNIEHIDFLGLINLGVHF